MIHERLIEEFWQWWELRRVEFDRLADPDDPLWDATLNQLQRIDENLWFELSEPDDDARQFIITAEGNVETFPIVDAIVARAPEIWGWNIISLKPPRGFEFEICYEGINFDAASMWFLPLTNPSHPKELGLRIGIPNLDLHLKSVADSAVVVIVETGLGELSAALDIEYLEADALPTAPEDEDYIRLQELSNYIEWRKQVLGLK